jgi:hypothetical protein
MINSTDFDFDEVSRNLGEHPKQQLFTKAEMHERLRQAIRSYTHWLLRSNGQKPTYCVRKIALRVLSSAWVVDPEAFSCVSIRQLQNQSDTKFSRTAISRCAATFSEGFGVVCSGQRTGTKSRVRAQLRTKKPPQNRAVSLVPVAEA